MNTVTTPPLRRRRGNRLIAGVAGGLADHLGVRVVLVRATFAVLTIIGGMGAVAYGVLWLMVRQGEDTGERMSARERQQAVGLGALGVALMLFAWSGAGSSSWLLAPAVLAVLGIALVWWQADMPDAGVSSTGGNLLSRLAGNFWVRVGTGAVLVVVGLGVFLVQNVPLNQIRDVSLAVIVTFVGFGLLTIPWWLRLIRDLGTERRARIRTEERADIAAHLHDSVLQTLALIQRQPDAPREVRRLARGQERELRNWLYGVPGVGTARQPDTLSAALSAVCAEIEDGFAVQVRPVFVGDAPMAGGLFALVAAAREAVVNAAKHAGVTEVSVYAEVEDDQVHVFVRDRGRGFDPDSVPDDRHGLTDSIQGRMRRHGGSVRIKTASAEGTEISLAMPRDPAAEAQR